jgi:hypothetical protein
MVGLVERIFIDFYMCVIIESIDDIDMFGSYWDLWGKMLRSNKNYLSLSILHMMFISIDDIHWSFVFRSKISAMKSYKYVH